MFDWICPSCYTEYTYKGVSKEKATSKCSNQICERYKLSTKIWQYKKFDYALEKKKVSTPSTPSNTPKKIPLFEPFLKTAITMCTYAINTIKNKKQVLLQDENSTWYQYYKDWTRIKQIFRMMEKNGV